MAKYEHEYYLSSEIWPNTNTNIIRNATFCEYEYSDHSKKTPSKMDVAPWDKHWIKRELDGFGLYSMVFVEIQS